MYLLAETNLEDVLESVNELKPDVLIVDSIQTLYNGDLTTAPGSVGQVKDCTMALMQLAKGQGITVFAVSYTHLVPACPGKVIAAVLPGAIAAASSAAKGTVRVRLALSTSDAMAVPVFT